MKKIYLLLSILISALFITACGSKEKEVTSNNNETKEKIITIGIDKDAANLNPILISELVGESFAANIFDTLVSYKDDVSTPAPALAESWDISEDGKTYTFNLRKGVKFHNGEDFSAEDVKYTIDEINNPDNASPSKQFFTVVEAINILDDYTIEFKLNQVYPSFLLALGSPQIGIVPKDHVEEVGHNVFDRNPVGTGPFIFEEWVPDTNITLVKNPNYWGGIANIDKAIFKPIPQAEVRSVELKSNGVDLAVGLTSQDIASFSSDSNYIVKQVPGLSLQYLAFSAVNEITSDVRFRKAVYHATDFANAIPGIYGNTGERAYSWIPPVVLGNDLDYMKSRALPYNEEKAKELFDELIKEGKLAKGQVIPILSPQDQYRSGIATAVASSLIKFGFKPEVQTLEFGTLLSSTEEGKTAIFLLGWGSVPDPDRWTYSIFHTEAGKQNRSAYSNDIVDGSLEKGRSTVDAKEREEAYKVAMRKALGEDYIHIPLTFKTITTVSNAKVENFEPSPQGYIYLFTPTKNVNIK